MIEVDTQSEWEVQANKANGNYLIFKHSTTCPISAKAFQEVREFEHKDNLPILLVKVIESRPLSLHIANQLGIVHASPQVILMEKNSPVWNTSHYDITVNNINKAKSTHHR